MIGYDLFVAVIHISEVDAARDFAGLMARVKMGAEIAIENGSGTVAMLHLPVPVRRTMAECIALLPSTSSAIIDEDFAQDVSEAIAEHRETLNPPVWD